MGTGPSDPIPNPGSDFPAPATFRWGGYRMRLPTVEMYCSVCSNIAEIGWIEIAPTA
jgi:hypothetical protein